MSNEKSTDKSVSSEEVKVEVKSGEATSEPTGKSIFLTGHGGYDKLSIQAEKIPEPSKGEVLVKIKATGLNFAELVVRQGLYDKIPKLPAPLGYEASGIVEKTGPDCSNIKVGQRVMCVNDFGLWREFVCLPETYLLLMPENMTFEEAAAIPVNYLTAYLMLFDFGNLRPSKKVLVHMAAGGVGWAATQLCKTVPDVTVFGTASSHKHDAIKGNGVQHPIDYHKVDYADIISKLEPEGLDIVLDPLSGSDSPKGYNLLRPMGKIIHFGVANMIKESRSLIQIAKTWWQSKSVNRLDLTCSNRAVCGLHVGHLVNEVKLIRGTLLEILRLYSEGKIKPRIDSVWPYEQIGNAMSHMHQGKNIGKILLSPELPADTQVVRDDGDNVVTIDYKPENADKSTATKGDKD